MKKTGELHVLLLSFVVPDVAENSSATHKVYLRAVEHCRSTQMIAFSVIVV